MRRSAATGASSHSKGLAAGAGVLFEEVTLDEGIGPEAVALLIEPEPDELLGKTSLDLNLKAGIAPTVYGPILFLIWWIPPIVNGHAAVFYEQLMNPLYPKTSEVLRRVAEQTHLHVILTHVNGQVLNVFEYQNSFGFGAIRAGVDVSCAAWTGSDDFQRAKRAYEQQYEVEKLIAGEYE